MKPVMEGGNVLPAVACWRKVKTSPLSELNGVDVHGQQKNQLRGIQGILEEEVARGLNKDRRH